MKRKHFFRTVALTSAAVLIKPSFFSIFSNHEDGVILPSLNGEKIIVFLRNEDGPYIDDLHAQYQVGYDYYGRPINYGYIAPYNNWYSHQQAVAQYNAYLIQQQQYYSWINSQQIAYMQSLATQYSNNYQQFGQPYIADAVESIYAFARQPQNQSPILFGLNGSNESIETSGKTLRGAASVWDLVNRFYGNAEAERSAAPQSDEYSEDIVLPDGKSIEAIRYDTENGSLAVSKSNVTTQNGQTGKLVEYVTGPDGELYQVV